MVKGLLKITFGARGTVNLAVVAPEYVQWLAMDVRRQQRRQQLDDVFSNCVEYLGGFEIPLSLMKDLGPTFRERRHTASICRPFAIRKVVSHDSTAFKGTAFYQRQELMSNDEYILGDKASKSEGIS